MFHKWCLECNGNDCSRHLSFLNFMTETAAWLYLFIKPSITPLSCFSGKTSVWLFEVLFDSCRSSQVGGGCTCRTRSSPVTGEHRNWQDRQMLFLSTSQLRLHSFKLQENPQQRTYYPGGHRWQEFLWVAFIYVTFHLSSTCVRKINAFCWIIIVRQINFYDDDDDAECGKHWFYRRPTI